MFARMERYRPTRVEDGEGGWTSTFAGPAGIDAGVEIYQNRTVLLYHEGEDVQVEDVIDVDGGNTYYRILGMIYHPNAPVRRAEIERTSKPETG